jgi:hypothetical protein
MQSKAKGGRKNEGTNGQGRKMMERGGKDDRTRQGEEEGRHHVGVEKDAIV